MRLPNTPRSDEDKGHITHIHTSSQKRLGYAGASVCGHGVKVVYVQQGLAREGGKAGRAGARGWIGRLVRVTHTYTHIHTYTHTYTHIHTEYPPDNAVG
jgi:hypothetical protein